MFSRNLDRILSGDFGQFATRANHIRVDNRNGINFYDDDNKNVNSYVANNSYLHDSSTKKMFKENNINFDKWVSENKNPKKDMWVTTWK